MKVKDFSKVLRRRLREQWIVCKLISSRKSVQYGIRFSYPVYISIVLFGVITQNPFVLSIAAIIALLGMLLPMHPFDYLYNYVVAKLFGSEKIPGRGSELQVNSNVALIFTLIVIAFILTRTPINYNLLAFFYLLSSIFFLFIFILRKDSNIPKKTSKHKD